MTAAQLRDYAEDNGIDLQGAKTKTKVLAIILGAESSDISVAEQASDSVITAPEPKSAPRVSNTKANDDGVITVRSADKNYPPVKADKKTPEVSSDKVAVYSAKNLHWQGVGKLTPGYNILTKEAADKWLTNKHVREASAQEVAAYYGKS